MTPDQDHESKGAGVIEKRGKDTRLGIRDGGQARRSLQWPSYGNDVELDIVQRTPA